MIEFGHCLETLLPREQRSATKTYTFLSSRCLACNYLMYLGSCIVLLHVHLSENSHINMKAETKKN